MYCRPKLNGNTPVEPALPQLILGEIRSALRTQITFGILARLKMSVNTARMHGAFSICMEMSWNGSQIGTILVISETMR